MGTDSDDETVKAIADRWARETTPPRLDGHRMKEDAVDAMIALGIGCAVREAFAAGARSERRECMDAARRESLEDIPTNDEDRAYQRAVDDCVSAIARRGAPQPEAARQGTHEFVEPAAVTENQDLGEQSERYRNRRCRACGHLAADPVHAAAPKKEGR